MKGAVGTKERCPKCEGNFEGKPLSCPTCKTTPQKYYVDLYWNGKIKLYSDKTGQALDSYARADRLLNYIRTEIDEGTFDPKNYQKKEVDALRFKNYVDNWLQRRELEYQRGHIPKSYMKEIKSYILRHYLPFFQQTNLRNIREGHIQDFKNQLPPHINHKTVANILGVLRTIFSNAFERRDILVMPKFPKVQFEEPVTRWITWEEQQVIIEHLPKSGPWMAFYLFLIKQGARPNEARALRWENLDFKNDVVTIAAAFDRDIFKPHTKERDVRYLPLNPLVKEAILKLPRALNGFVFQHKGEPITHNMASHVWRRAALKAGIQISCYEGTRHSVGSQAANAGVSIYKISAYLGHKDIASTKRYAKLITKELEEVWVNERPREVGPQTGPKAKVQVIK